MVIFFSWEKIKDITKFPKLFHICLTELVKLCKTCETDKEYCKYFLINSSPSFSVLSVIKFMTFELLELKHCFFSARASTFQKRPDSWKHGLMKLCSVGMGQEVNGVLNYSFSIQLLPSCYGKFLFTMVETDFPVWWAYETDVKICIREKLWCCTSSRKLVPLPVWNPVVHDTSYISTTHMENISLDARWEKG